MAYSAAASPKMATIAMMLVLSSFNPASVVAGLKGQWTPFTMVMPWNLSEPQAW